MAKVLNEQGQPCSCENDCPRNGKCTECRAFHAELGKPNACDRLAAQAGQAQEN